MRALFAPIAVLVWLTPFDVFACPPCHCTALENWVVPMSGERGIPRNVAIFVSTPRSPLEQVRLYRADDLADVPFTQLPADGGAPEYTRWLMPESVLEANTDYVVSVGDEVLSRFQTGGLGDETSPSIAGVSADESGTFTGDLCGPSVGTRLTLEGVDDDRSVFPFLVQIDVGGLADGPKRLFFAWPFHDSLIGHAQSVPSSGDGTCLGGGELGLVEPGPVSITVTVVDRAGNRSASIERMVSLYDGIPADCGEPPSAGPFSCAGAGVASPLSALVIAVGLTFRRRRADGPPPRAR